MKKISLVTIIVVIMLLFSACGASQDKNEKMSVVCTNYAVYDWVCETVGKSNGADVEVTLLSGSGDVHSYQPTAQDIASILSSSLFVYVGGTSDAWAEKLVMENNINALRLVDVLDAELICGESGHEEDYKHTADEVDEHIWLSLKLAQNSVLAICDKLCDIDKTNGDTYKKNAVVYSLMLEDLDERYSEIVEESADRTIVFADRFPFAYMMKDYGINCVAAFPGCSADTDASFSVIADLAETVDVYKKKTLLVLENSALSVAKAVVDSTKEKSANTAVMNSCQSVSAVDIEQGISYLAIMEENLKSLELALQ